MRNILKKNQLVILVISLMLVTAGYLNYTGNTDLDYISTSTQVNTNTSDIGDAKLVNSEVTEMNNTIDNNKQVEEVVDEKQEEIAKEVNSSTSNINDYFISSKLGRDTMYSQMLESYQKIIESTNVSEQQKTISNEEIKQINDTKNAIMIAENLIKTKGFEDCIIFVNDININLIVKAENLKSEEIAQIQNILSRELKAEIENIHISTKK